MCIYIYISIYIYTDKYMCIYIYIYIHSFQTTLTRNQEKFYECSSVTEQEETIF